MICVDEGSILAKQIGGSSFTIINWESGDDTSF